VTGPGPNTDETGIEPVTSGGPGTGDESDGSSGGTDGGTGQSGDGGGCACSSGAGGRSPWWLALLVGARLRRRRRAS
jgi:MYXO-CTERM domain-containing protein